jgi:hypothetical protein
MDLREAHVRLSRRARRDPAARRADGDRESDLGLQADPRRAAERRATGWSVHDRPDPQGRSVPPIGQPRSVPVLGRHSSGLPAAPIVIAAVAVQTPLGPLTGWLDHREREAISYPIEDTASCSRGSGHRPGNRPRRGVLLGAVENSDEVVAVFGARRRDRMGTPGDGGFGGLPIHPRKRNSGETSRFTRLLGSTSCGNRPVRRATSQSNL